MKKKIEMQKRLRYYMNREVAKLVIDPTDGYVLCCLYFCVDDSKGQEKFWQMLHGYPIIIWESEPTQLCFLAIVFELFRTPGIDDRCDCLPQEEKALEHALSTWPTGAWTWEEDKRIKVYTE